MALGHGISFSPPRHWIPATLKSKHPYEKHGFALWRKHAFGWALKTNRAKLKLGVLNVKPCAGSTYCDGREERLFATRRWLWVTAQMQKMQSCFVVRWLWNCIYIYMAEARIMLCQHVVFAPLSCWGMIARNGYILLSLLPKGILEEIWEDLYTCYIDSISIYIVRRPCLPFISSSPTPHITINFSTPTPQHMLSSSHMSCPIRFPNSTLTHFTFNFHLAIFLVVHLFLLPMFSPVIPIHVPNFLRIFSSPAFPIPQANIACSIFSPI